MRLLRTYQPVRGGYLTPFAAFQNSPWSGLEAEIDRLFDNAIGDAAGLGTAGRFAIDLYEDRDNAYVRAELPGVTRDAIHVEVVDGTLTITASRKTPATGDRPEESFSFSRSVTLPSTVDETKVTAAYENGVLTATLPKREEVKPRKINVAVN